MPKHFLIHELLNSSELEELETFAREPGRTHEEIGGYLQDHGHTVSKSSVGRWKQMFDQRVTLERMSSWGGFTKSFMETCKSSGGLQIADAAMLQTGQMIFELGNRLSAEGQVSVQDVNGMALSLQRMSLAMARTEKTRTEMQERERAVLAEASDAVKAGATGEQVVTKVRELLGLPV